MLLSATSMARPAQDFELFDDSVLRTIDLTIVDANGNTINNYWNQLVNNWAGSGANMRANLVLSGSDLTTPIAIDDIGVRIKGNSSFFFLPQGSRKASFNLEIDHIDPDASLGGYETINLNNGIEDPTFSREIGYHRFIGRYTPAGSGNHVVLTINGEAYGVYVALEQYNKDLLEQYFVDGGGVRHKCPNIGGAALRWFGSSIGSYFSDYELKNDGGLGTNAAWTKLVEACNVLNNIPTSTPELIDERFSMDSAIWTVVAENLFMDEDSYISKGADFNVFWDPRHNRTHLHQHDGNESWGVSFFGWPGNVTSTLSPTYQFTNSQRPVMSRIRQVPEWRERYFAHYRTMLEDFTWGDFEDQLHGYRDLIDSAVQADPKKLYTYAQFLTNYHTDTNINVGGSQLVAPGLQRYVDDRIAYLSALPEMMEPAPAIAWARHAPYRPMPGQSVTVTAKVSGPSAPVDEVLLYYRHIGRFESVPMTFIGGTVDTYSAVLPLTLAEGEVVEYYVGAQSSAASGGAMRFYPKYAEGKPLDVRVGFGDDGMRFTEYLYSGGSGEFAELTNVGNSAVDMTGWSFDDSSATSGVLDLSSFGTVMPGESVIITDASAVDFATEWGLSGVKILGDNSVAKLGRNDSMHVFDSAGTLIDRLAYGDERYEYSVKAKDESAYVCSGMVGQDSAFGYRESEVGDTQMSFSSTGGDLGSPGNFVAGVCDDLEFGDVYCSSTANSTGVEGQIVAFGSPVIAADDFNLRAWDLPLQQFGYFLTSPAQGLITQPGGSHGNLCLGAPLGRLHSTLANSGTTGVIEGAVDLYNLPLAGFPGGVAVNAGEAWNFQLWYRDNNPVGSSNFSPGLEVVFQ